MIFKSILLFLGLLQVTAQRTLVLLEKVEDSKEYSQYFQQLEAQGLVLDIKSTQKPIDLIEFEVKKYDNLLVLGYKKGVLNSKQLVDFVNLNGNVQSAVAVGELADFALELSAKYQADSVSDIFHPQSENEQSTFYTTGVIANFAKVSDPVLYTGSSLALGKNALLQPVLVAMDSAMSTAKVQKKTLVGSQVVLVSAFQALNNARVLLSASPSIFSDKFMNSQVTVKGQKSRTGNTEFAKEVGSWVFQKKNVLRVKSNKHHRVGEVKQHGIYTIKEHLVYELELEIFENGNWKPFTPDDAQLEVIMLDPYIIKTFTKQNNKLLVKFQLPDHYGIFTLRVDYKRRGYSYIDLSETIQVRPLRQDQYARFITAAYPYYINLFSMMGVVFAVSAIFLLNHSSKKVKTE